MSEPGAFEALISQQIVTAMKAHDADRTGTLRLIKNALKNKSIEKRAPLTQAEGEQALASMIKQRRDSIEQFTKGNRPDLVAKDRPRSSSSRSSCPRRSMRPASPRWLRKRSPSSKARLATSPRRKRWAWQ